MATKKSYFNDITFLKAIATLFITWFHFKWSVPPAYSSLFIGGAIGNSIFFFCSGYLLSFKEERYAGEWIVKKYFRLMPAVWITLLLMLTCSFLRYGTFESFSIVEWLYPKQFWFVRAILLYFLLIAIVFRINSIIYKGSTMLTKNILKFLTVFLVILHFVYYWVCVDKSTMVMDDGGFYCWFYWFLFFIWGYYARNYGDYIEKCNGGGILSFIGALLSIIFFFTYKTIAPSSSILMIAQCVFIPFLLAIVVVAFRFVARYLMSLSYSNNAKSAIVLLSNITLEVYIVQMYIIRWLMPEMPFPINVAVTFVVILIMGYLVHLCATWCNAKLKFL